MFDEVVMGILAGLGAAVPSGIIGLAVYVLTSLSLYTIAQRRGLHAPWLAWIPVARVYLLGSLSDQYCYILHRQRHSRRKVLLVLAILSAVLSMAALVMGVMVAVGAVGGVLGGYHGRYILEAMMGPLVGLMGLSLPLCGVAIALAILRFMALYDVYKSLDPVNAGLYLVLSILIHPTEAFFLFFNRNKDDGMPPRKKQSQPRQDAGADEPEQPAQDWQPQPTAEPVPGWQNTSQTEDREEDE